MDSGALLNFFHTKSSFITYESIPTESVHAASSTSKLILRGTIQLPIDGGTIIEAYYTPEFSANILSVRLLLETFKIDFKEDNEGKARCIIKNKNNLKVIQHLPEEDVLFPLKINKITKALSAQKKHRNLIEECHCFV